MRILYLAAGIFNLKWTYTKQNLKIYKWMLVRTIALNSDIRQLYMNSFHSLTIWSSRRLQCVYT